MSTNVILCCNCGDTTRFVQDAIQMIKPNQPVPAIYAGADSIRRYAEKMGKTNMGDYAKALVRNKDKFAYYFEYDDNGDITEQYNLKTGSKLC